MIGLGMVTGLGTETERLRQRQLRLEVESQRLLWLKRLEGTTRTQTATIRKRVASSTARCADSKLE